MAECLFCKIIKKEIPSEIVYQDQQITIFKDINPSAPVHLLVIPNKHLSSILEMSHDDEELIGKMFSGAKYVAEDLKIDESGYRLIINNGPDAHQEVFHLHMHLLGGGKMKHPLG